MKYLKNVVTLEYNRDKCIGCGRCIEVCPQGVYTIEDKRARVIDRDNCMECGACALNCEYQAITVDAGVGCSAAIIRGMLTGSEPVCGCDADGSSGCC